MGFLARASSLFYGTRVDRTFHTALAAPPHKEASLKEARRDIRSALRNAANRIQLQDEFWQGEFATRSYRSRPVVTPRFRTQGSVAYDLLVDPCQSPPQQVDLDDGVYFNVQFLDNGQPALTAQALFAFIEQALQPLRLKNGWKLKRKHTCIRVQLSLDAHIDLPIYSAPTDVLEEELAKAALADAAFGVRVAKRAGTYYVKLPSDKIMLAHSDGTWQQSDPLKLHGWVDDCVTRYGSSFRRACRYFKGWRDNRWPNCCLSSIVIMAAVERALRLMNGTHRDFGDDRMVFEIAQLLPGILNGNLMNPAFPGENIVLNDWDDDERADIVGAATTLAKEMNDALKGTGDSTLVVQSLRRAFGDRIPYRPDLVEIVPIVAATVVTEKAAKVPIPLVSKSTSG